MNMAKENTRKSERLAKKPAVAQPAKVSKPAPNKFTKSSSTAKRAAAANAPSFKKSKPRTKAKQSQRTHISKSVAAEAEEDPGNRPIIVAVAEGELQFVDKEGIDRGTLTARLELHRPGPGDPHYYLNAFWDLKANETDELDQDDIVREVCEIHSYIIDKSFQGLDEDGLETDEGEPIWTQFLEAEPKDDETAGCLQALYEVDGEARTGRRFTRRLTTGTRS